jgi:hypothetical protein
MLNIRTPRTNKFIISGLLVIGVLIWGGTLGFSSRPKSELIRVTARGTGTQSDLSHPMSLEIYAYSTPADKQLLSQAFAKGQNQGLVDELGKMKAVGFCHISQNVGYNIRYIQMTPTPTGRRIQFITDRQLRFGEAYHDRQSSSFNLAAGEIDLNDTDKSKSTGYFYSEAKLMVDEQGQLKFELVAYPWRLMDIIDWQGTPKIN